MSSLQSAHHPTTTTPLPAAVGTSNTTSSTSAGGALVGNTTTTTSTPGGPFPLTSSTSKLKSGLLNNNNNSTNATPTTPHAHGTLPSSRPISRAGFVEPAGAPAAGSSSSAQQIGIVIGQQHQQQSYHPAKLQQQHRAHSVHPALVKRDPLSHAAANYSFTKWAVGIALIFVLFVIMDCFQIVGRNTVDDGRSNTQNILALSWVCQIIGLFGLFFSFLSLGLFQHPFTAYSMVLLFVTFILLFSSAALYSSKTTWAFLSADNNVMAAFVLQWISVGLYFFYLCFLMANCFTLIREAARAHATQLMAQQQASIEAAAAAASQAHGSGGSKGVAASSGDSAGLGLGLGRSGTTGAASAALSEELVALIKQKDRDIEQRGAEVKKLQEQITQQEEAATKRQVELADNREKAERAEEQVRRANEDKQKAVNEAVRLQELLGSSQDQIAREAQRLGNEVARLAEEARRNGEEAKEYKALCGRLEAEKTALAKQMANRKKEGEMLASKAEEILSTVDDQETVIAKSKETVAALRDENKKLRETLATQKVVLEAEKGELQKKLRAHAADRCEQEKKDLMSQVEALRESAARQLDPNTLPADPSKLLTTHPLFKNLNKLGGGSDESKESKQMDPSPRVGQLPPMDVSAQLQATQQLLASVVKEHAQCEPLRQRCAELEKDLATCEKHWSAAQKELARTKAELGGRISELENDVVVYEEQLGALRGDSEIRADLVREAQARFSGLRPQLGCEFMPGPKNGVRLTSVMPGKSADIAGLAVNDIVEQVNGRETRTKEQFKAAVSSILPGDAVPFQIERGRDILTVVVHVGTQGMTQQQIMDLRRMASGMVKDSDIRAAKAAKEQASLPPSTA